MSERNSAARAVRIGISGSPESTPRSGTEHAVRRCRELGIDALEMAWVHSVRMGRESAERVRAVAARLDVSLSVHAPYYINLNSRDAEKRRASIERIVAAGRAAVWAGARDVVLHLAWNHDDPPDSVMAAVVDGLRQALEELGEHADHVILRPELMGKRSQFGDLDEVLDLCREVPRLAPCIDIAHLHARTGAWNTVDEFERLWDAVAEKLGEHELRRAHVHISGIAYGPSGENRHLSFEEADLDYRGFLQVLARRGVRGTLVVESPAREDDVRLLADAWREIHRDGESPEVHAAGMGGGA